MEDNMMKKLIAMLLAMVICLALAACGGGGTSSISAASSTAPGSGDTSSAAGGEPVTLTYWMHSSAAVDVLMDELVKEFNEANPDIIVKTEYIPFDDYMSKLIPASAPIQAPMCSRFSRAWWHSWQLPVPSNRWTRACCPAA